MPSIFFSGSLTHHQFWKYIDLMVNTPSIRRLAIHMSDAYCYRNKTKRSWSLLAISLTRCAMRRQDMTPLTKNILSVIRAVQLLRCYLKESCFVIWMNHQASRWILEVNKLTGRLARWKYRLVKFVLEIVNRLRFRFQAADAISRLPRVR